MDSLASPAWPNPLTSRGRTISDHSYKAPGRAAARVAGYATFG
jgi:hypothetical protein